MKKQGTFVVPENGYEEIISLGFVPKIAMIEFVAKNDPVVGDVIMRFVIDNTGAIPYWYPQMKSGSETKDFGRHLINDATGWPYGKIAHLGNYIGFETTQVNDFIGKTFSYYATNEEAGTFVTSSYQYGVVNVPKTKEDKNIFVSLPFSPTNLTTAFYVDCVEDMPSPTFDAEVQMSRWSIPAENTIYYIDPHGVPGDTGETGIINSYDNYFVFRSNAGNTQGVTCHYYKMPQISNHLIDDDAKDYFLYNVISDSTSMADATRKDFYKYKTSGKLALYEDVEKGYDLVLKGTSGIEQILYSHEMNGDYEEVGSTETHFLQRTQRWSDGDNFFALVWRTNIPIFAADGTHTAEENADRFLEGEIDETDAVNYDKIAQEENLDIDGKIGDKVTSTKVGSSDLAFTNGVRLFALTNTQKGAFFNKLFDTNVTPIQDLLDGTQLFGANEIGCIQGLHYIPFQASEVCTMGSQNFIKLGSYKMEMGESLATCLKNDKFINCGTAFFKRTYNDYRDFEPFCSLFLGLPFAGVHKLQLSKYYNKLVGVHYCVDISTGALMVRVMADGVLMDTFDGQCATQIPITANDHARQTSAVLSGLLNTAGSTIETVGSVAGAAANAATIGANAMSSQTSAAMGNIIGAAGKIGGSALSAASPIINGYQTLQSALSAPVTTRGSYAGNLGNFGLMHPTFYFAWLNTVVPENEIALVGKPSAHGGKVGNFNGFLQCAAFDIPSGFGGTDAELEEIYNIMRNGIYIS